MGLTEMWSPPPLQAASNVVHLDCAMKNRYGEAHQTLITFNEDRQTVLRTQVQLGSVTRFDDASITPSSISFQKRVRYWTFATNIDRTTGTMVSTKSEPGIPTEVLASGTCKKAAPPTNQQF